MCMTILSILIVALLFCCIVYNSSLSREFAVSALLGHNKLRFCLKKVVSLTFIPFPVSFVALNITLYVLTGSGNFFRYIYAVKTLYPASAIVMALIFAMEFVLLLFKVSGLRPVYVLKGYGKTYGKLTAVFKILSIATVLYMSVITLFSAYQYLHLKPNIDKWNNSKNYVDIYCTWPSTHERDDEKLQKVVTPKLSALWDKLNKKGALMYFAPYTDLEQNPADKNYNKTQEFEGNYAYINKNFLNYTSVIGKSGRAIRIDKVKAGEWIVLTPENKRVTEDDKLKLKATHAFETGRTKKRSGREISKHQSGTEFFHIRFTETPG